MADGGEPDVRLHDQMRPGPASDHPNLGLVVSHEQDQTILNWVDGASFRLVDGREIWIERMPELDLALLRALLLGPVMAALLHQRGYFVRHASAVSRARRAVVFVGDKGAGKSTMAAAMLAAGWTLLADDVVAVGARSRPVRLAAGPRQLRLEAATATLVLGIDGAALPPVHALVDKRSYRPERPAELAPSLDRIYLLQRGQSMRSTALAGQRRVEAVLAHAYVRRFGVALTSGEPGLRAFREALALVAAVPVHELERRDDLAALKRLPALIEHDLLSAARPAG